MEKILKNRFKLVRTIEYHLGTGSCSEVYLGKDLQTNSSVAIKIIQKYFDIFAETQTIAISTEKKVLKICESPHTNKLIDDFEDDQNYYLFFELCDGDLEALLRKKGPFKVEDIRKIFIQLNQVFSIMNNNQIIHRDLKLANVLYTYTNSQQTDFDVELSDFGVSKILQEGVTRSFKGTIYSMAPEIIEGDDYTTKADLWSIGIMMYQLLLKKNPFLLNLLKINLIIHLLGKKVFLLKSVVYIMKLKI